MNWINYQDLYRDCISLAEDLPRVDAIVGIPRSGMLPATILSTILNVPLGALVGHEIQWLDGGVRDDKREIKTIFVVDDSVDSGWSMETAMAALNRSEYKIYFGCVYLNPKIDFIQYYARKVPQPRMFAWNFMNCGYLEQAMVDIDGVLCRDILPKENVHGGPYEKFISEVGQRHIPGRIIHSICSARPESIRIETEAWLNKNNIDYNQMFLLPRVTSGDNESADFKARVYKESDCIVFIESSDPIAQRIAELSKKPVICTDTMELYG